MFSGALILVNSAFGFEYSQSTSSLVKLVGMDEQINAKLLHLPLQ